jgi:hypothetical protein
VLQVRRRPFAAEFFWKKAILTGKSREPGRVGCVTLGDPADGTVNAIAIDCADILSDG